MQFSICILLLTLLIINKSSVYQGCMETTWIALEHHKLVRCQNGRDPEDNGFLGQCPSASFHIVALVLKVELCNCA